MDYEKVYNLLMNLAIPENNEEIISGFSQEINGQKIYWGKDLNNCIVFACESNPQVNKSFCQSTIGLKLSTNINSTLVFDNKKTELKLDLLTCISKDESEVRTFIRLCYSFANYINTNDINSMRVLFNSLSKLFSNEQKASEVVLQGLYAELYVLKHFFENEVDISEFWQKKEKMKFDFSIDPKKRIEVKSTTGENRIHHFLHEQLLTELYDIKVISVLLRRDDVGLSLYGLVDEIRTIFINKFDLINNIENLIKNIPTDSLKKICYDEIYTKNNLKIIDGINIPRFNETVPLGVSRANYDSDLNNIDSMDIREFINWIRSTTD